MAAWWERGVVYQIYPRSFQDTNEDGIGDIPGIIQRLDYLQWLGVDALWISPMYPSPMADFGYDVSNYRDVHPMFGTLDDLDALIEAAHQRDLKILLDFVPSHTSDQHPWFIEARSSRDNPKRDWYIWKDPGPNGEPPTNWLSRFDGESAWEWDEATQQFYLHSFLAEQPDVNWRNEGLREAMLDVLRFWYRRGIDGFRVDVSYRAMKDDQFRDNPLNPNWQPGMDPHERLLETYTKDRPEIHMFNRWLREVTDEFDDRVLIGEINVKIERLVKHYGDNDEFHLPFNFRLIFSDWTAEAVRDVAARYEAALPQGAWPNWVLGNHDQPRFASRVGSDQARLGMMLLLTLRGTPTLYYGDELGMVNGMIPPEKVADPWEKNVPGLGRDPERTPMQWSSEAYAGFTAPDADPWLPAADNYPQVNVEAQREQPDSMLTLTQRLLTLRRESQALNIGDYLALESTEGIFAFQRQHGDEQYIIVLNFTHEQQEWVIPHGIRSLKPVISTELTDDWSWTVGMEIIMADHVHLQPDEGVILRVGQ